MDMSIHVGPEALSLATAALGAEATKEARRKADAAAQNRVQSFAREFEKAISTSETSVGAGQQAASRRRHNAQENEIADLEQNLTVWHEEIGEIRHNAPDEHRETAARTAPQAPQERAPANSSSQGLKTGLDVVA